MKKLVTHPRIEDISTAINQLIDGGSGAVGLLTLAAGAATTTVTNPLVNLDSVPILTPTTATAAAEIAAGGCYVSAVNRGSFVVTHANSGVTDRSFRFALIGG